VPVKILKQSYQNFKLLKLYFSD